MEYAHKFQTYTIIFTVYKGIHLLRAITYYILVILFTAVPGQAQEWNLHFVLPKGSEEVDINQNYDKVDRAKVDQRVNAFCEALIKMDYLESGLDSLVRDTSLWQIRAYMHLGPKYHFETIKMDSISKAFLEELKLMPPVTSLEYLIIRDKISEYYARQGFPFAKVRLKNGDIVDGVVSGQLAINTGPKIMIDSLIVHGDVNIRHGYLENYLKLFQGEIYDHTKMRAAGNQLNKLTFLKQEKDPALSFFYDYVSVNLYLKKKNSSRFDFIFGIIPTNAVEGKQLFLSLDLEAEMLNKMGYGEYFYVNFERLRPEQQKFDLQFNYPYLLDLPFAVDLDFAFFRNSFDYQTVKSDIGFQYLINSTDYIKIGWDYESSRLVDVDTAAIKATEMLPEDLDISQNGLALEVFVSRLDYKFNPRRGYKLRFKGVGGQRKILRNTAILALKKEGFDFNTIYDGEPQSTPRYEALFEMSWFQPIAMRAAIGFHFNGGWRYVEGGLRRNEKFQIGGNKLLRGFDEASVFTSYYAVSTLEYRLLLSDNSYFSLPFIDFGMIETSDGHSEFVAGIGGSLGFETKVGLFNFSIAAGRTGTTGFDFARPKAHFGFVSLF